MKKNIFLSLVSFTIASIIGVILFQGYWIYSSWNNKEEEFSLSVQQSIQNPVAKFLLKKEEAKGNIINISANSDGLLIAFDNV